MTISVIKTGGKQYIVKEGDALKVEKIDQKDGESIKFETLLIAEEDGSKVEIGKPTLESNVEGKVVEQSRDKKILVVKYKAKTRYRKRVGHRQAHTTVSIDKV